MDREQVGPDAAILHMFPADPNGYYVQYTYSVTDLTGATLVPIDLKESFENHIPKYTNENWGVPGASAWLANQNWSGNTFVDNIIWCWGGDPAGTIPDTDAWNPNSGGPQIDSITQKFWIGTQTAFTGECGLRQALNDFTTYFTYVNVTTPVTSQSICAAGQFANN